MIKVLSLFSGIGAFEKALKNLNIDFELVAYCDFDKYASKSYSAIHGVDEGKNLGDITKIDEKALPKDIDLITYGFPCQDISLAGKQKGFVDEDGNTTRSGLFFDALRIIEETQPKIAIAENVKNLTGKKFAKEFEIVLTSLDRGGYNNYWQVLNAKDFGVPQNRERVFIVSIRKDIDHGLFEFPKPFELTKRLKDLLEDEVDEKFYITKFANLKKINDEYSMIEGGTIGKMHDISRRVYNANYIAPTLHGCGGGNTEPKVEVIGNYSPSGHNASRIVDTDGIEPTVMENHGTVTAIEEIKGVSALQRQVCETAIQKGLVKPNDIIDYTYSNSRLTEMATGGG